MPKGRDKGEKKELRKAKLSLKERRKAKKDKKVDRA